MRQYFCQNMKMLWFRGMLGVLVFLCFAGNYAFAQACTDQHDSALAQYQEDVLDGSLSDPVLNPSVLLSDYTDPTISLWDGHTPDVINYDGILVDGVCQPTNPVVSFDDTELYACMTSSGVPISANVDEGNPVYSYTWVGPVWSIIYPDANTISAGFEGNYTVQVVDQMSCEWTGDIDVMFAEDEVVITSIPPSCVNGESQDDGSISVPNGIQVIAWSPASLPQTANAQTWLGPGSYSVTYVYYSDNDLTCEATDASIVFDSCNPVSCDGFDVTLTPVQASCGVDDGQIVFDFVAPTALPWATYTIKDSAGTIIASWITDPSYTISGLASTNHTYTVSVTTQPSCTLTSSTTITQDGAPTITVTPTSWALSCDGAGVEFEASVSWASDSSWREWATDGVTSFTTTSAWSYTFTASNGTCSNSTVVEVTPATNCTSCTLLSTVTSSQITWCVGQPDNNGSITVSTNDTTDHSNISINRTDASLAWTSLTDLSAGTYAATITYDEWWSTCTREMNPVVLTNPTNACSDICDTTEIVLNPLTVIDASWESGTCNDNWSIAIGEAFGGTAPYTIVDQDGDAVPFNSTIAWLAPGIYGFVVTDDNECEGVFNKSVWCNAPVCTPSNVTHTVGDVDCGETMANLTLSLSSMLWDALVTVKDDTGAIVYGWSWWSSTSANELTIALEAWSYTYTVDSSAGNVCEGEEVLFEILNTCHGCGPLGAPSSETSPEYVLWSYSAYPEGADRCEFGTEVPTSSNGADYQFNGTTFPFTASWICPELNGAMNTQTVCELDVYPPASCADLWLTYPTIVWVDEQVPLSFLSVGTSRWWLVNRTALVTSTAGGVYDTANQLLSYSDVWAYQIVLTMTDTTRWSTTQCTKSILVGDGDIQYQDPGENPAWACGPAAGNTLAPGQYPDLIYPNDSFCDVWEAIVSFDSTSQARRWTCEGLDPGELCTIWVQQWGPWWWGWWWTNGWYIPWWNSNAWNSSWWGNNTWSTNGSTNTPEHWAPEPIEMVKEFISIIEVPVPEQSTEDDLMRKKATSWCYYQDEWHSDQEIIFSDITNELWNVVNELNNMICLYNGHYEEWELDTTWYFKPNRDLTRASLIKLVARVTQLDRFTNHDDALGHPVHRWRHYVQQLQEEMSLWYTDFELDETQLDNFVSMREALALVIRTIDHHVPDLDDQKIQELYNAIAVYDSIPFNRSDSAYLMQFLFDYLLEHNPYAFNTELVNVWYAQKFPSSVNVTDAYQFIESQVAIWELASYDQSYRLTNLASN